MRARGYEGGYERNEACCRGDAEYNKKTKMRRKFEGSIEEREFKFLSNRHGQKSKKDELYLQSKLEVTVVLEYLSLLVITPDYSGVVRSSFV